MEEAPLGHLRVVEAGDDLLPRERQMPTTDEVKQADRGEKRRVRCIESSALALVQGEGIEGAAERQTQFLATAAQESVRVVAGVSLALVCRLSPIPPRAVACFGAFF